MFSDALMLLPKALGETVYMVAVSMIVASAIGIPLGVLLLATGKNQVLELGIANKILSAIVKASSGFNTFYSIYYFNGGNYSFYKIDSRLFYRYYSGYCTAYYSFYTSYCSPSGNFTS